MDDWMIAALAGGFPTLGLLWRAVWALVKLQLAATELATSMKTTLHKQLTHIEEEKRHHAVVEGYLRTIAGVPAELARTPSGRIPTQPHAAVNEEASL